MLILNLTSAALSPEHQLRSNESPIQWWRHPYPYLNTNSNLLPCALFAVTLTLTPTLTLNGNPICHLNCNPNCKTNSDHNRNHYCDCTKVAIPIFFPFVLKSFLLNTSAPTWIIASGT